jgi:hypothetical protein
MLWTLDFGLMKKDRKTKELELRCLLKIFLSGKFNGTAAEEEFQKNVLSSTQNHYFFIE